MLSGGVPHDRGCGKGRTEVELGAGTICAGLPPSRHFGISASMAITFNCPCGKVLSAHESDAGKKGVCPHCGKSWKISSSGQGIAEDVPQLNHLRPRDVENWLFAHQHAMWGVSAVLVVAIGVGFAWYSGRGPFRHHEVAPQVPPPPPRESISQAELDEAELLAFREPAALPISDGPPESASASNPVPLTADSPPWTKDFEAFAQEVQTSASSEESLREKFTHREVRWKVTFSAVYADSAIFFDEAAQLLGHRPPIQVWASVAPNEIHKLVKLKAGDEIILRGVMGHVTNPRTAEHPAGVFRLGPKYCVIENMP